MHTTPDVQFVPFLNVYRLQLLSLLTSIDLEYESHTFATNECINNEFFDVLTGFLIHFCTPFTI